MYQAYEKKALRRLITVLEKEIKELRREPILYDKGRGLTFDMSQEPEIKGRQNVINYLREKIRELEKN